MGGDMGGIAPITQIVNAARAVEWQAAHCERNGASLTERVLRAFLPLIAGETACGARMRDWPGLSLEDAMPLRLAGGFHYLHLTGAEPRLAPIYAGKLIDQAGVDAIVADVARDHDARLLRWFDGPPQTNEAGRSAAIMAGLTRLSARLGPRFELNEIGSSAGANAMIERYAYDLGGVTLGPPASPVLIRPEWRGRRPSTHPVEILAIEGCDLSPIDLADPEQALRLKSYVWAENTERMARLDAVIGLARQKPPRVTRSDAADWVEARLAAPQAAGVMRVLYHSIVWQYIAGEGRARIEAAMASAGERATPEKPLAWIALETNRETFSHELRVRYWPGGEAETLLARAHAHGAWVEWFG